MEGIVGSGIGTSSGIRTASGIVRPAASASESPGRGTAGPFHPHHHLPDIDAVRGGIAIAAVPPFRLRASPGPRVRGRTVSPTP